MPIPNSWGTKNNDSALTGVFPNAMVVNGTLSAGSSTIASATAGNSGVFIPFKDLTGLNVAASQPEIGLADDAQPGPEGNTATISANWTSAGAARFVLGILEAGYAAQQNSASADRLSNCVMTRSALSVVDEDTLQKTFTVKFKLNHTSQDVEDE